MSSQGDVRHGGNDGCDTYHALAGQRVPILGQADGTCAGQTRRADASRSDAITVARVHRRNSPRCTGIGGLRCTRSVSATGQNRRCRDRRCKGIGRDVRRHGGYVSPCAELGLRTTDSGFARKTGNSQGIRGRGETPGRARRHSRRTVRAAGIGRPYQRRVDGVRFRRIRREKIVDDFGPGRLVQCRRKHDISDE